MKERPILFNGAMVRAILEGRKTQTRRIMKPQPVHMDSHVWSFGDFIWSDQEARFSVTPDQALAARCPHGKIGDRLWVRETCLGWWMLDEANPSAPRVFSHVAAYAADGYELEPGEKWIPSIHTPRAASRLTLEVTGVRVERLKEIRSDDCFAEGIDTEDDDYSAGENYVNAGSPAPAERWAFSALWNSTGGDWEANPWVWVIEFRRVGA